MRRMRLGAALAALAVTGAAAVGDDARAATVMHNASGAIVLDAYPGETNVVSVQAGSGGGVVLLDSGGAPLEAWDAGCTELTASMVECAAGAPHVELWLGDGNDRATVDIFLTTVGVIMHGEAGDDQLSGGPFVNGLDGGPGNDRLNGGDGPDTLHGGPGNDELKGLGGADTIHGEDGDDLVSGDSHKGPAPDVIDGGPGVDRIEQDWNDLSGATVTLTLGGGADDGRPGEGDDVRNVEQVVAFNPVAYAGTEGADRIEVVQVSGPSTIAGGGGDDFLKASDGADRIDGGPGADVIDGGFNDDVLIGGPGPDTIAGDHPTGECGIWWCKMPAGNDTILARDGTRDSITCGFGTDTVEADPIDVVAGDCEHVTRGPGGGGGGPGGGGSGGGGGGPRGGGGGGAALAVRASRVPLRTALAQGLRLRVDVPGRGRLRAIAKLAGRPVARGAATARGAGRRTVTLRFTRRAKRTLRRAPRVRLTVTVRFTARGGGGGGGVRTTTVALAR